MQASALDPTDSMVASFASRIQSVWGVNRVFSALQSAGMAGRKVPVVAAAAKGTSAFGVVGSAFKLWAQGNYTLPAFS
jgi:hypothetical protein